MKPGTIPRAAPGRTAKAAATRERVPFLDLHRQYAPIRQEILAAIERVCDAQHFVLGDEVERFERAAADFTGAAAAVGCASGTDAIWLALAGAGVQPGHEVITSPFTFFATASAIVRAGARPVFVDVDPHTLNLDPAQVEARLTASFSGRLAAILPVHLFGQCADMDAFQRLGAECKLAIVEDAAQAFGAAWRGRRAGALGRAAAFSFYPTKNLSAYGDGGCVTTSDLGLAERVRRLRNHGSRARYYHEEIGWNSRLDALQAAILEVKLKYIERWNRERRERAAAYDAMFRAAGLIAASGAAPIRPLHARKEAFHVYHQYVVRSERRDALREFLTGRGIGTEIYYPVPLHRQECFQYLGYAEGALPESERAAREVLALPIFPELTAPEQQHVVGSIAAFFS